MMRLNARELRTSEPNPRALKSMEKNNIYIILDNVLDTYNIGSIFRLADAVAAKKVFLCGDTESPPNPRIKKASINTWKWVEWEYVPTAVEAISKLKDQIPKVKIIAVEQYDKSTPLSKFKPEFPIAVIVGNETYGVSKEVLEKVDQVVELPMYGVNKSLNVMVTCAIVLYKIIENLE
ncbi:MAG: TrmH family RNA methyltransferase [Patescibacteria group bacterium]|nr:TrmH family RNA methyltransferase [Patescibacteria group bacterium]